MTEEQLAKEMKKTMRVRAKGDGDAFVGYYNHLRRRGGDVFVLRPIVRKRDVIVLDKDKKPVMIFDGRFKKEVPKKETKVVLITAEMQFSEKWMEVVKERLPETAPVHFNKTKGGKGTIANKLNIPGMTSKIGDGFETQTSDDDSFDNEPSNSNQDEAVI